MQNFSALNMKEHEMHCKPVAFHKLHTGSGHYLAHNMSSNPVVNSHWRILTLFWCIYTQKKSWSTRGATGRKGSNIEMICEATLHDYGMFLWTLLPC